MQIEHKGGEIMRLKECKISSAESQSDHALHNTLNHVHLEQEKSR